MLSQVVPVQRLGVRRLPLAIVAARLSSSNAPSQAAAVAAARMPQQVIVSGIQCTGVPHLGNYIGALRQWVQLQETEPAAVCYYSAMGESVGEDPFSRHFFFRQVNFSPLLMLQQPNYFSWPRSSYVDFHAGGGRTAPKHFQNGRVPAGRRSRPRPMLHFPTVGCPSVSLTSKC